MNMLPRAHPRHALPVQHGALGYSTPWRRAVPGESGSFGGGKGREDLPIFDRFTLASRVPPLSGLKKFFTTVHPKVNI